MALKGRILALWLVTAAALQAAPGQEYIEAWLQERLREAPEWFASAEAARIADNLLLYQRENGGWRKGQDAHKVVSDREKAAILKQKSLTDTMLDNGATHTQIRFLARVHQVNPQRRFRAGILKGIDWLLAAQYANGGWPQCWPDFVNTNQHRVSRRNPDGLTRFITFNDDVMVSALRVLDAVVECILRCQVQAGGKPAVWAGQHDEKTLAPRWARTFEPVALTASESVGVVKFLMEIEKPGPRVVAAVEAAVRWFEQSRIPGIQTVKRPDASSPRGFDVVVVRDPKSPGQRT